MTAARETLGAGIMARIDALAALSESPDGLTRRYLTPQHRQANDLVGGWMADAGMTARQDAVGNIVGRYEGVSEGLPAILIGSHLDTVVMAGKFDGMLGVVTGIACVAELNRRGQRLPFAIEVIGFGDEEGVRFHSTYLGSHALAGNFEEPLLARRDADDVTLAEAMTAFGLDPARFGEAARQAGDTLAYLELHIEQGPVLESKGLPVGVVTSIAGATRLAVGLTGEAGHAGTVPMNLRHDALAAAADCVLAVERVCTESPNLVGTVGQIAAEPGAGNVIPGLVRFTVDLRSAEDSRRASALAEIITAFDGAAKRRGVAIEIENVHGAASVPCDAKLSDLIAGAIERNGWSVERLPSGAGHDAAAMADLTPVGMIFVRCEGGVSHNPAESITAADSEAGARVLLQVLCDFPGVA
jgi:allantoate deiminase